MKSVAIVISHFESLQFLRASIRQIRKYKHEKINQHIFIIDQSCESTYVKLFEDYIYENDVTIIGTKPLYSGYGLDYLFRNEDLSKYEYIVQIHTDVLPVSKNWIMMPITLIEESKLAFVGQLQFIADGKASIYPPDKFFAMAQCYNVAPTHIYRELAMIPGFCRFHNRKDSGMEWASSDWATWASEDYQSRGSDDDVVAFHWQDKHRVADKLGLAITGYIEPSFGRLIEDCVFHFGSHREALTVLNQMPKMYSYYLNKINEDYSDELIEEMVNLAKANKAPSLEILSRNLWNGTTKESYPTNSLMNEKIEKLKNAD